MTRQIHVPKESLEPTKISSRVEIVEAQGEVRAQETATLPTRALVIEISEYHKAKQRPGFKTIDQLVQESERDPSQKEALREARNWIADTYHSNEPDSLRTLRLRRGLSQVELAKLAETKQAHIARIEAGSNVEVETLVKLARALDVAPVTLFEAFLKNYLKSN